MADAVVDWEINPADPLAWIGSVGGVPYFYIQKKYGLEVFGLQSNLPIPLFTNNLVGEVEDLKLVAVGLLTTFIESVHGQMVGMGLISSE